VSGYLERLVRRGLGRAGAATLRPRSGTSAVAPDGSPADIVEATEERPSQTGAPRPPALARASDTPGERARPHAAPATSDPSAAHPSDASSPRERTSSLRSTASDGSGSGVGAGPVPALPLPAALSPRRAMEPPRLPGLRPSLPAPDAASHEPPATDSTPPTWRATTSLPRPGRAKRSSTARRSIPWPPPWSRGGSKPRSRSSPRRGRRRARTATRSAPAATPSRTSRFTSTASRSCGRPRRCCRLRRPRNRGHASAASPASRPPVPTPAAGGAEVTA